MIADTVESTVKSLKDLSPESINNVIQNAIDFLIKEKQLIESNLTLKDLEIIKLSLLSSIKGIYGKRIEYPEEN